MKLCEFTKQGVFQKSENFFSFLFIFDLNTKTPSHVFIKNFDKES